MAVNIEHPEVDRLARELARRRGESVTDAVLVALQEQLRREPAVAVPRPPRAGMAEDLMAIGHHFSSLPLLDDRSDDEILGYDEHGLPR